MRTSTMVICGAVVAGAAWWWWSTTRAAPPPAPGVRPVASTMLPAIDWNFFNTLPIPGLSSVDNGMIVRPAEYLDLQPLKG